MCFGTQMDHTSQWSSAGNGFIIWKSIWRLTSWPALSDNLTKNEKFSRNNSMFFSRRDRPSVLLVPRLPAQGYLVNHCIVVQNSGASSKYLFQNLNKPGLVWKEVLNPQVCLQFTFRPPQWESRQDLPLRWKQKSKNHYLGDGCNNNSLYWIFVLYIFLYISGISERELYNVTCQNTTEFEYWSHILQKCWTRLFALIFLLWIH